MYWITSDELTEMNKKARDRDMKEAGFHAYTIETDTEGKVKVWLDTEEIADLAVDIVDDIHSLKRNGKLPKHVIRELLDSGTINLDDYDYEYIGD